MATSKGKILKEQITFDFFNENKVDVSTKLDKENNKTNPNNKKEKLKVVQTRFGKNKGNIKSSHKKQNRKVRRIRRKL